MNYSCIYVILPIVIGNAVTDAKTCKIQYHTQLTGEQSHHHDHSHGDEEDSCSPFCLCNCCGAQYMQLPTYYSFKQRTPEIEKSTKPLFSFTYAFELHTSVWHPPTV